MATAAGVSGAAAAETAPELVGTVVGRLRSVLDRSAGSVCGTHLQPNNKFGLKRMTIVELLDGVHDRQTFLAFAYAFAAERRRVEGIEAANPEVYQWGGAEGWNNNCISLFIEGGLSHFGPRSDGTVMESPTWKDLAEFLWCGRFME